MLTLTRVGSAIIKCDIERERLGECRDRDREREGSRHNEWIFIAHIFIRSHINEQTGRQKPAKMHVQSFACDVLTFLSRSLALQVMCMSVCFCVLFFSVLAHSDREILQEAG